jgi:D-psicose/D-tagatose/L-ribulose 3-epimerase
MPDIYFSFFMFTANLQPDNREYTKTLVGHMRALLDMGHVGFDLPIAPGPGTDFASEVKSYQGLRQAFDDAGLRDVGFTTNVGATRTFDPSSMYKEQRELGLQYLKSRIDITKALGGEMLAGPIILPYGVFPMTDGNQPIWSDDLHDWLEARYSNANPIIEQLGQYAAQQGIKVAIEPVDHWETPSPNMVREVARFVQHIQAKPVGICVDSAHVVLGSDGPVAFTKDIGEAAAAGRLNYVHISAPDRGALADSWIPWSQFLMPIMQGYDGPFLVEVFNAIPVFLNSLRLTRRKFCIPGEDANVRRPDAYDIAREGIETVRRHIGAHTRAAKEFERKQYVRHRD